MYASVLCQLEVQKDQKGAEDHFLGLTVRIQVSDSTGFFNVAEKHIIKLGDWKLMLHITFHKVTISS